MSLTLNETTITFDVDKPHQLMDIYAFIDTFKYDIDRLYIDRFWNSINNNQWVVVNYDMLKWMGYTNERDRENRRAYLAVLNNNFIEGLDYEDVCNNDPRLCVVDHAQRKITIIRSRQFKESLMLLQTERSREIRRYYTFLEEILIDFMRYSQCIKDHNYSTKLSQLERKLAASVQLPFDIDQAPMVRNEYVYVLTNKHYYRQMLFKIGKSINPKSRLISYNTGAAMMDDEMFYIAKIATFDCSALEKLLHQALEKYHHRKEWFHIPHKHLFEIIKMISDQQIALCDKINYLTRNGFDDVEIMDIEVFDQFKDKPLKMICPTCAKIYKMRKPFEKHVKICVAKPVEQPKPSTEQSEKPPVEQPKPPVEQSKKPPTKLSVIRDGFKYRCTGCRKGYLRQTTAIKHVNNHACKI